MRHGKADGYHLYADDFFRPLIERGQNDVLKAAIELRKHTKIDCILASPSVRTAMTARIVANLFELKAENILFKTELYNSGVTEYLKCLEDIKKFKILLLGHNPSIAQLGMQFANGEDVFKTSEILGFQHDSTNLALNTSTATIFSHLRR